MTEKIGMINIYKFLEEKRRNEDMRTQVYGYFIGHMHEGHERRR
jgi:hypothetical protein